MKRAISRSFDIGNFIQEISYKKFLVQKYEMAHSAYVRRAWAHRVRRLKTMAAVAGKSSTTAASFGDGVQHCFLATRWGHLKSSESVGLHYVM
jgi:hypothetical protein